MNKLPKLIAAVDAYTMGIRDGEKRKHLGASAIGHKCKRRVWYGWRWALTNLHEARMLRLFGRGHREEPEIVKLLRGAGVTVYDAGESGELKEQLRISGCDGHFGGTPDGIVVDVPDMPPGEAGLLEMKTHNDKRFQKLKENGVFVEHLKYYIQMQVYMHFHGLPWGLYVGVNKNDDELYFEIIRYKKEVAVHYFQLADETIKAVEPPPRISESPGWHECKWCDMAEICHGTELPDINCRTCIHGSPGGEGKWVCALRRKEIEEQNGCPLHVYDPVFLDRYDVVDYNLEKDWYVLRNKTMSDTLRIGNAEGCTPSKHLKDTGVVPF